MHTSCFCSRNLQQCRSWMFWCKPLANSLAGRGPVVVVWATVMVRMEDTPLPPEAVTRPPFYKRRGGRLPRVASDGSIYTASNSVRHWPRRGFPPQLLLQPLPLRMMVSAIVLAPQKGKHMKGLVQEARGRRKGKGWRLLGVPLGDGGTGVGRETSSGGICSAGLPRSFSTPSRRCAMKVSISVFSSCFGIVFQVLSCLLSVGSRHVPREPGNIV